MRRSIIWESKPWQAFKTFAIVFSFIMNFVLLLVILFVLPLLLPIVNSIANPIVGGLNQSFNEMSQATISRTIPVRTTMPISFTLPLEQQTTVVVTEGVPLVVPARMSIPGNPGSEINGIVSLTLPAGLELPVSLAMEVPVDQEIDVALDVGVDIPLADTDLGTPFVRLQSLFGPLSNLIDGLPDSRDELFERIMEREAAEETTAASSPGQE